MSIPGGDKIFQVSDFNLVSDCVLFTEKKKKKTKACCVY